MRKQRRKQRRNIGFIAVLGILLIGCCTGFARELGKREAHSSNAGSYNKVDKTESWKLVLVNNEHKIPRNYKIDLTKLGTGQSVDTRMIQDLQAMFDDARNQGVYPLVTSGFRTKERQQEILNEKILEYEDSGMDHESAKSAAEDTVALPDYSEHQLGLACDINADSEKCNNEKVYSWLLDNAYRYGFILRYPENKKEETGIDYEPWHYRYVGKEAAAYIYKKGICLEEYLRE